MSPLEQARWIRELDSLETKRRRYHEYITLKLEEHDYHGIADAAMDLRDLEARVKAIKEFLQT